MVIVKTMCARDCPDACFLDVEVEEGVITSVKASTENPVTAGITCPRASGDPSRVYSMQRVMNPYIRVDKKGEKFRLGEWDEALDLIAGKLKETIKKHGPESVLLLDFSGNVGMITSEFSKRLWNAIGATKTDYTLCSASGHAALKLHYGLSYGQEPEELLDKNVIIFWGFNARVSSPHQWALATKARNQNNAIIVVIDPRKSETAERADLWLYPKPGSDVALCYGVTRWLVENDQIDHGFLQKYANGYIEFLEEALKWTPERVEEATGISWDGIELLGEVLTENSEHVFMIGLGLQKGLTGAESVRAVSLLPALLGSHRGFYYTNSEGRYLGGDLSGASLTGKEGKVVSMISLGERLEAGEFKFVYVQNMNPALTLPDSIKVHAGLSRDDVFVVVHDTHLTETCNLADIVIPAPTYLEKDDLVLCDCHPYVRLAKKAVEPYGNSRNEVLVMRQLAENLDLKESWVHIDPWRAVEETLQDTFIDGTLSDLLEGATLRLKKRPRDEYTTPSGKIEFTSTSTPVGVSSLPEQYEICYEPDELVMLNSAVSKYTHTQFRDVYGDIPCEAWINPFDAEKNNVVDGMAVKLYNEQGELNVTAIVTDKVPSGVVWCPREIVDTEGNCQNNLASGKAQLIGGGPGFNSIRVRIKF